MNRREATLAIEGMSCGHCVAAVTTALEEMDGVEVQDVEIGSARVAYDSDAVTPEELEVAVQAKGYEAYATVEAEDDERN
ncbi:MAG: heavy-metal-associated domain-containing protein [Gemmatimonadota bacterium]